MNNFVIARTNMVKNQLMPVGIKNNSIIEAFYAIPREEHTIDASKFAAYRDSALYDEKKERLLMLRPEDLAKILQELSVEKTDLVLSLYASTGYSSFLLAHLADEVVAAEANPKLAKQFANLISKREVANIQIRNTSGFEAIDSAAPFDKILVNDLLLPEQTEFLLAQLKDNGKMIAIEKGEMDNMAVLYFKINDNISRKELFAVALI